MPDDLHDALTDLQGVGDATAEKIADVVAEYDTPQSPLLERAVDAAQAGDDREAAIFLRRWARE